MTTTAVTRDPVQGLVDYVLDVKPYHTKILEIWVEYIYNDNVSGRVKDALEMDIHIDIDRRLPCKYGWDTSPWDMFWNVDDVSDIATGNFTYVDGTTKTVPKFDAYRLFFQYLTDRWKWRIGEQEEPVITSASDNPYRLLSFASVMTGCTDYWRTMSQDNQFWLDPRLKRLYKRVGGDWEEVLSFYYSATEPHAAIEGEYWFSTTVSKLYARLVDGWAEINKVYMSYDVPDVSPTYPENWKSNWDYPLCGAPYGETTIHARVSDLLSFEHGSEIFLFDHARVAVVDPTGRDVSQSEYTNHYQRLEHPVKFRTSVIQTSRNRFKLLREEVSVITEPDNPEIANTTWTIDLNGYDFEGWDIERVRKDVKIGNFLTWKGTDQGTKLLSDNLINLQTFRVKTEANALVAQRTEVNGSLTDIDVPWANGTIVYLRSTGSLPGYTLATQDAYKSMRLDRYRPYRIVYIAGEAKRFSLALVDHKTLTFDTELMGSQTKLTFDVAGNGRMYIGIGYPVPFMEVRTHLMDSIKSLNFKDQLSSSMEAFLGHKYLEIEDVLLGFTADDGQTHNGFVIEGNFKAMAVGSEIKIASSYNGVNDGAWTVSHNQVWSNYWIGFESNGTPIPASAPLWWNDAVMGVWPNPTKKPQSEIDELVALNQYGDERSEYNYNFYTTLGVSGPAPTTLQRQRGYITLDHFNFSDGAGVNKAAATVADKLLFGSLRAVVNPDGTTTFIPEPGVPGVSLVLKEAIVTTIQEGLNRDDPYGGPTIGSYDVTYFDQDTYDENLATIAMRLQDQ